MSNNTGVEEKKEEKTQHMITVVVEKPPIWDEAKKHFEIDDDRTVFTYGDKIYNPANLYIDDALFAHEATHADQQLKTEGGPAAWWKRYFEDTSFRLEQELQAYRNQYEFYCRKDKDRNRRARFLVALAGDLAGPTYKVQIAQVDAQRLIRNNVR